MPLALGPQCCCGSLVCDCDNLIALHGREVEATLSGFFPSGGPNDCDSGCTEFNDTFIMTFDISDAGELSDCICSIATNEAAIEYTCNGGPNVAFLKVHVACNCPSPLGEGTLRVTLPAFGSFQIVPKWETTNESLVAAFINGDPLHLETGASLCGGLVAIDLQLLP